MAHTIFLILYCIMVSVSAVVSFRGEFVLFRENGPLPLVRGTLLCYNTKKRGGNIVSAKSRNVWAASVLLALVTAAVLGFLFRLSQPDKAQESVYLNCTETDRGGWIFFTESGPAEPVFGFGGYIDGIPAEGDGPVAAERVMEDTGPRRFLQFDSYGAGLQVFLDGTLLYTDFPAAENRVDRYLENVECSRISYEGLRVPLPEDCAGKLLRIVTYGPSFDGLRQPLFPMVVSRFSDAVVQTTGVVWPMAAVTAQLLLAVCLLLVLLISAQEGKFLWKLLPLIGYFLLAGAAGVCHTYLESSAGLDAEAGVLNWIYLIYMDLLYCYLAAVLHGWKRWVLRSGALLHILLSAIQSFAALPPLSHTIGDWLSTALFLMAAALLLFSRERPLRRISLFLCVAVGCLFALWGVTRFTGTGIFYPLTNPVTTLLLGYPHAFYALLCGVAGLLCAVQVVMGFMRWLLLRQRQMQAIKSGSRAVWEQYEQAQDTVRQTAAFRHEWKNHVAALHLLAQKQDQNGLLDYLNRLDGQLEQLSPKVYTANPTVNTILQRFAAQAQKQGVLFRVNAMLPETLGIEDEDLCSFLFNLLDNALEAASNAEHGEIVCSLQIRQQYLAIRCENTFSGKLQTDENGQLRTTKQDEGGHGFGLLQLRTIAEKYGSVLDISYDDTHFTVMTALKLRAAE